MYDPFFVLPLGARLSRPKLYLEEWVPCSQLIRTRGSCDPSNPDICPQQPSIGRRSSKPRGIDPHHPKCWPSTVCAIEEEGAREATRANVYRFQAGPSGPKSSPVSNTNGCLPAGDHNGHFGCV